MTRRHRCHNPLQPTMVSSSEEQVGALSPSDAGADVLGLVAEAILSYLDELDGYRATCLRHEATVGVSQAGGMVRLVRAFAPSRQTLASVRRAAQSLPLWERSPFWGANRARWTELAKCVRGQTAAALANDRAVVRGVAWEGRPV